MIFYYSPRFDIKRMTLWLLAPVSFLSSACRLPPLRSWRGQQRRRHDDCFLTMMTLLYYGRVWRKGEGHTFRTSFSTLNTPVLQVLEQSRHLSSLSFSPVSLLVLDTGRIVESRGITIRLSNWTSPASLLKLCQGPGKLERWNPCFSCWVERLPWSGPHTPYITNYKARCSFVTDKSLRTDLFQPSNFATSLTLLL
jgi:hypothetical protein